MLKEPFEVMIVGGWLDPEAPVEVFEKGYLEVIQLLQSHSPDVSYEVVPVKYVIVKL
jgi:hypothetical protein